MSDAEPGPAAARVRREPPHFRRVEVRRAERLSRRMVRVTLAGPGLQGFSVEHPAASVRLLLPSAGTAELVMPAWNGNQFLLPDGRRPTLRTLTPRRFDPDELELDVEIVVHGGGAAGTWAEATVPGDQAAISGPGRGYVVPADAPGFLLAGDETAIPAISQLLGVVPATATVDVHIGITDPGARLDLPHHPRSTVAWHERPDALAAGDAFVAAVEASDLAEGTRVWVAGEAAAVQRVRRYLFEERGVPRGDTWIRGYWKHGRSGDAEDDA